MTAVNDIVNMMLASTREGGRMPEVLEVPYQLWFDARKELFNSFGEWPLSIDIPRMNFLIMGVPVCPK